MATQIARNLHLNAQLISSELGITELCNYQILKAVLVHILSSRTTCEAGQKRKTNESVADVLRRLMSQAYPSL